MPTEVDTGVRAQGGHGVPKPGTPWKPSIVAELAEVVSHDALNPEYRHLRLSCSVEAARRRRGNSSNCSALTRPANSHSCAGR